MDGNYSGTVDVRIESADTIIYLDYPTLKYFCRVVKRIVKYHESADMPQGCKERLDFEFYTMWQHLMLKIEKEFLKN